MEQYQSPSVVPPAKRPPVAPPHLTTGTTFCVGGYEQYLKLQQGAAEPGNGAKSQPKGRRGA